MTHGTKWQNVYSHFRNCWKSILLFLTSQQLKYLFLDCYCFYSFIEDFLQKLEEKVRYMHTFWFFLLLSVVSGSWKCLCYVVSRCCPNPEIQCVPRRPLSSKHTCWRTLIKTSRLTENGIQDVTFVLCLSAFLSVCLSLSLSY